MSASRVVRSGGPSGTTMAAEKKQENVHWIRRAVGPALVLLVLVGALTLLRHELRNFHFREVRASLRAIAPWKVAACLGLATLNYVILIGYDLIGVRSIGHPLLLRRVALASFAGF